MSSYSGHYAGHIGSVFKHSSLCHILKIEKPIRYHETNSAGAEYSFPQNADTEYGISHLLKSRNDIFENSEYIKILKENGLNSGKLLGSPAFAMNVLRENAEYHFHDIEEDAINNIKSYNLVNKLSVRTHLGDSIKAFLDDNCVLNSDDFVHIDPFGAKEQIFGKNKDGNSFLDIFEKAITSGAKTFMWYGYKDSSSKQKINDYLKSIFDKHKIDIAKFELWQSSMDQENSDVALGVLGCGVACVNLCDESLQALGEHLELFNKLYENATYNGHSAPLSVEVAKFQNNSLREMKKSLPDALHEKSEFYSGKSDVYERFSEAEDFPQRIPEILIDKIKGKKVLDFGCGNGRYTKILSAHAKCYCGIDSSQQQIEKAKKKCPGIDFQHTDGEKIPFDDNSFDVILSTWVLSGIPDEKKRLRILQEMKRVLNADGKICLLENDFGGQFSYIERKALGTDVITRQYGYISWLKKNGFNLSFRLKTYFRFISVEDAKDVFGKIFGSEASEKVKSNTITNNVISFESGKKL